MAVKKNVFKEIMRVALPTSLSFVFQGLTMLLTVYLVVFVVGKDGVAVFMVGNRVMVFTFIPLIGLAGALTSV